MKTIKKTDFLKFLSNAMKSYRVIAPVKMKGENSAVFSKINSPDEINLKYRNTKKAVKEIFFPQEETLFFFNKEEEGSIKQPEIKFETILFGVRSCDLKGIEIFDNVFAKGAFPDPYYIEKREKTILLGIGCLDSEDYCFCESMGIEKSAGKTADATFYEIGENYIIELNSEKAKKLLASLADAPDAEINKLKKAIEESPKQEIINIDSFKDNIDDNFEHAIWEEVSKKCIGCSICAYLCPTCHCFDVSDEVVKGKGRRYRSWDACMFSKFTLHTSGHNPRTKNSQRMRQRIMHKFNYLEKNKNVLACSGCGRCIINCPVNLDIREIIKTIAAEKPAESKK